MWLNYLLKELLEEVEVSEGSLEQFHIEILHDPRSSKITDFTILIPLN